MRTVQYMLDQRIIYTPHLVFGLKATTRFPLKKFEEAFEIIKDLMGKTASECVDTLADTHATDAERASDKGKYLISKHTIQKR